MYFLLLSYKHLKFLFILKIPYFLPVQTGWIQWICALSSSLFFWIYHQIRCFYLCYYHHHHFCCYIFQFYIFHLVLFITSSSLLKCSIFSYIPKDFVIDCWNSYIVTVKNPCQILEPSQCEHQLIIFLI